MNSSRMMWMAPLVLTLGSVSAQVAEIQKLYAGQASAGDHFGTAVSVSGRRALVGANGEGAVASTSGAAYIFDRGPDGAWVESDHLFPADGSMGDNFGRAVSLSGDRALVSSHQDDGTAGANQGSAYVFERQPDGAWLEVAKLEPSVGVAFDEFGWSVALCGEYAAVGSFKNDMQATNAGIAYVFERQPDGTWPEVATLTASDATTSDEFGWSMALSGETLLVGAPRQAPSSGSASGAVYVFERSPAGTWSEVHKLVGSDTIALDYFGWSVALDGDCAIVGAYNAESAGEPFSRDEGAAYVFERVAGEWDQVARLEASDAAAKDEFGYSVGISADRAVVGAWNTDVPGSNAGSAYVFERGAGGQWTEREVLTGATSQSGDLMGAAVAVAGDIAVIGARGDQDFGSNSGSVYLFDAEPLSRAPAAPVSLSLSGGGIQTMELDAGGLHAGELYWLLGTTSGTAPGIPLAPGLTLPLNPDFYLNVTLSKPNQAPLQASFANLNAAGHATASFALPTELDPALAGVSLHHAFVTIDALGTSVTFVSNALELVLIP